jgi:hypothetical protein
MRIAVLVGIGIAIIVLVIIVTAPTKRAVTETHDACASLLDIDPHCGWTAHWEISPVSTNKIDGVRTQFVSMESTDPDGITSGDLHYAKLHICFDDGKLCRGSDAAIFVTVHGMVQPWSLWRQYNTWTRVKFDDEKPTHELWTIADSHDALIPPHPIPAFLGKLEHHRRMILEFSYFEKASRTVTFELAGLAEKVALAGK